MRHSQQRGFTLLELLISLALLSIAMLLATSLLFESQSYLLHASEQLIEPAADQAVQQIRADLRSSSGFNRSLVPGWSRDPLILAGHPAGNITYLKDDDELIRILQPAGTVASTSQQRLILQQVTTWRWRPRGRSVEIDLGHRSLGRLRQQTRSGRWREPANREVHRIFWVTPRAAGGGRQW